MREDNEKKQAPYGNFRIRPYDNKAYRILFQIFILDNIFIPS